MKKYWYCNVIVQWVHHKMYDFSLTNWDTYADVGWTSVVENGKTVEFNLCTFGVPIHRVNSDRFAFWEYLFILFILTCASRWASDNFNLKSAVVQFFLMPAILSCVRSIFAKFQENPLRDMKIMQFSQFCVKNHCLSVTKNAAHTLYQSVHSAKKYI